MKPTENDPEEGMDEIALRELVQSLRTQLAEKEAERDAAIKEANRRDQKWMA